MMRSMLSSNSELQIERCLITEEWKTFLIFMTKFTWFLSLQSCAFMKIQSMICYVIPFLTPGTPEASYFEESDVIKFGECFENLEKNHEMSEQWITEVVSCYCE